MLRQQSFDNDDDDPGTGVMEMAALKNHEVNLSGSNTPPENHNENGDSNNGFVNQTKKDSNIFSGATTPTTISTILRVRMILYVSHFFAQFADIAWQFCLVLFLAALTNYQSLVFVSSYGLCTGLAVVLCLERIGNLIDSFSQRLFLAQVLICASNAAVIGATTCCYVLLSISSSITAHKSTSIIEQQEEGSSFSNWLSSSFNHSDNESNSNISMLLDDNLFVVCLLGLHLLGAVAQVLSQGFLIAIERDWVVVICQTAASIDGTASTMNEDKYATTNGKIDQNDDENSTNNDNKSSFQTWLATINVSMKQIDLACKIAGPAVAGCLIPLFTDNSSDENNNANSIYNTYDNSSTSPMFQSTNSLDHDASTNQPSLSNGLRNVCVGIGILNLLALCTEYICTWKIYNLIPALAIKEQKQEQLDPPNQNNNEEADSHVNNCCSIGFCKFGSFTKGLKVYFKQSSCWGGLGLALLYANALTLSNGIITAYLLYRDMPLNIVGICRAIASAVGLLGTFVYSWSVQRTSLEFTGLWSIAYQFLCLLCSCASLYVESRFLSLFMLVLGVCFSRIGLWVYDIAITQIQQQEVANENRGIVGGVQQALNSFFYLNVFVLGIFFPDPAQFYVFVFTSVTSVGVAFLLYTFGLFIPRSKGLLAISSSDPDES